MAFFYSDGGQATQIEDSDAYRAYLLTRDEAIPAEAAPVAAAPSLSRMTSHLRRWGHRADLVATDLIDTLTARKIERLQHGVEVAAVRVAGLRVRV